MFYNKIKEQWKAECTKIGIILKKVVSSILAVGALAVHYAPDIDALPEGFVSMKLKSILGGLAVASFLLGGFSRKSS